MDSGETFALEIVCRDPEDEDKPCPICDGKGVYALEVPVSDPRFGKFQRCPNNPVREDRNLQARLRRYGNLEAYSEKTFDSFNTAPMGGSYTQNVLSSLRLAKAEAQQFAADPQGWIVLNGKVGCGKTHLAAAICNERLEKHGHQAYFVTAPDLLDLLRMTFDERSEATYDEDFERIRNVALLLLDDLGLENPSPWAKEKLFQLLNYRHVNQLPTIITTNQAVDEYDPWLSSRLMDDMVKQIRIVAPDYRRTRRARNADPGSINLQLYDQMRFDNFDNHSAFRDEAENLSRAAQLAREWVVKPQGWLCLMGAFGSGKTHLAAAIANQLYENGKEVTLFTVPDLLDVLRQAFDPQQNTRFDKRFHEILNAPILVLDDLRLASGTPWAKEKLFQIIDFRYLARMPTVITTSETLEEMDKRFASRLLDQRICQIFAIQARSYVMRSANRS